MTPAIVFRPDVGSTVGVGHVMRSLALAEELADRGASITFVCDAASVPWVATQIQKRGFNLVDQVEGWVEHIRLFGALAADAVVFDSYLLPTEVYRATKAAGFTTLALIDNETRGAEADILLDQNIGAESDAIPLPPDSERLAGLQYALLRRDLLRRRPLMPPAAVDRERPKVLGVFGGTDAYAAAPVVAELLTRTGVPFEATLITREDLASEVAVTPVAANQSLHPIGPTDRLADLVVQADLVVSAAGSSTWEMLALGAATALVCVAANQQRSYRRLVDAGVAVGLGEVRELRTNNSDLTVASLAEVLTDEHRRSELSASAWRHIDGLGRTRVAERLLAAIDSKNV